METCLSCRGLKELPGMGMFGTRICDVCNGKGKLEKNVPIRTCAYFGEALSDPKIIMPMRHASTEGLIESSAMIDEILPIEDTALDIKDEADQKKAGKQAKNKSKWKP